MKKVIFLLYSLFSVSLAAQNARTLFTEMPDTILFLLTPVNRADMVDFLDSKMKAQVTNRLEGQSEMKAATENYIAIDLTSQSSWQMKLLPTSDSTFVIGTIHTVCGKACDSEIRFYTSQWEPLPTQDFLSPPIEDDFFYPAADTLTTDEYEQTRKIADIYLRKADLSADNLQLTFTYTTPDYVTTRDREKLELITRETITYTWNRQNAFLKED
ncbi:MAG: DUF3256 family protein [Bacteroides sp.]|nr:DUF3256 family protein [Bacteroides sp.]